MFVCEPRVVLPCSLGFFFERMEKLKKALNHPIWKNHVRNQSVYHMDGKTDRWVIVYYPIMAPYRGPDYDEPRALMQNIDKPGFWNKEVPLRYLETA